MTSFNYRLATIAACAALALPVLAQNSPTPPVASDTASTSMQQQRWNSADRQAKQQQWQQQRADRRAARMADLKQRLALTESQEPAWLRFTESMQANQKFSGRNMQGMPALTTPERIERMRALHAERSTNLEARLDATKTFYAQLQPEQQRNFDVASGGMRNMGARGGQRSMHKRSWGMGGSCAAMAPFAPQQGEN